MSKRSHCESTGWSTPGKVHEIAGLADKCGVTIYSLDGHVSSDGRFAVNILVDSEQGEKLELFSTVFGARFGRQADQQQAPVLSLMQQQAEKRYGAETHVVLMEVGDEALTIGKSIGPVRRFTDIIYEMFNVDMTSFKANQVPIGKSRLSNPASSSAAVRIRANLNVSGFRARALQAALEAWASTWGYTFRWIPLNAEESDISAIALAA